MLRHLNRRTTQRRNVLLLRWPRKRTKKMILKLQSRTRKMLTEGRFDLQSLSKYATFTSCWSCGKNTAQCQSVWITWEKSLVNHYFLVNLWSQLSPGIWCQLDIRTVLVCPKRDTKHTKNYGQSLGLAPILQTRLVHWWQIFAKLRSHCVMKRPAAKLHGECPAAKKHAGSVQWFIVAVFLNCLMDRLWPLRACGVWANFHSSNLQLDNQAEWKGCCWGRVGSDDMLNFFVIWAASNLPTSNSWKVGGSSYDPKKMCEVAARLSARQLRTCSMIGVECWFSPVKAIARKTLLEGETVEHCRMLVALHLDSSISFFVKQSLRHSDFSMSIFVFWPEAELQKESHKKQLSTACGAGSMVRLLKPINREN